MPPCKKGDDSCERSGRDTTVATFRYDLLARVKCLDCNNDVYGIADPVNSLFNHGLKIVFNGSRKFETGEESGLVQIGGSTFKYRSVK